MADKIFLRHLIRRMHNPAHPGLVLREYLGELTITEAAARLAVTRTALSRILNGSAGISADMALRLRDALGTSAEMWLNMRHNTIYGRPRKSPALPSYRFASRLIRDKKSGGPLPAIRPSGAPALAHRS